MTRILAVSSAAKALGTRGGFDAVVLVGHDLAAVRSPELTPLLRTLAATDATFASAVNAIPAPGLAGSRLITAPTGPITRDHDDVRRYAEAAAHGMRRARDAGSHKPLLVLQPAPDGDVYAEFARVAALGAAGSLWQPLEAREARGKAITPIAQIGVAVLGGAFSKGDAAWVEATDGGLALARDLCGTDPERMAPPKFAAYVQQAFKTLPVKVTVQKDVRKLQQDYPLLMAVARASLPVLRHRPNVVRLEYTPKGKVRHTLLFAGKGLTYDTGGADLKTGGHMSGMSRDKGGAAAVAGLFHTVASLRLPGVRLIAELGVVRNSIGSDSFVSDEIVTSHAGCRVRIGNTDAEGRLVLADLLSHLRVAAAKATTPRLFSVATLTGHADRAVGPYN
ncbi:MAG: leucyl aminopeptidase family protein, partial [Planctomycetes bacterium]|nr:leucyl aminopeptidase family protein [Planctomycetota bacterium]